MGATWRVQGEILAGLDPRADLAPDKHARGDHVPECDRSVAAVVDFVAEFPQLADEVRARHETYGLRDGRRPAGHGDEAHVLVHMNGVAWLVLVGLLLFAL